jgi:hypothetical protein
MKNGNDWEKWMRVAEKVMDIIRYLLEQLSS